MTNPINNPGLPENEGQKPVTSSVTQAETAAALLGDNISPETNGYTMEVAKYLIAHNRAEEVARDYLKYSREGNDAVAFALIDAIDTKNYELIIDIPLEILKSYNNYKNPELEPSIKSPVKINAVESKNETIGKIEQDISIIGEKQAKNYQEALDLCIKASLEFPQNADFWNSLLQKIQSSVSYGKDKDGELCVIFPVDVFPKPLKMRNASMLDLKNITNTSIERGKNAFMGEDFLTNEKHRRPDFYGKQDYFSPSIVFDADNHDKEFLKNIPTYENRLSLVEFVGGTHREPAIDIKKSNKELWISGMILTKLLGVTYSGFYNPDQEYANDKGINVGRQAIQAHFLTSTVLKPEGTAGALSFEQLKRFGYEAYVNHFGNKETYEEYLATCSAIQRKAFEIDNNVGLECVVRRYFPDWEEYDPNKKRELDINKALCYMGYTGDRYSTIRLFTEVE